MATTRLSKASASDDILIDPEEKELYEKLDKQSEQVLQSIVDTGQPLSVLVTGGSQNGKSSLIKALFGEEFTSVDGKAIATGSDGKPVTQDVTSYFNRERTLELIDTPGLERNISAGIVQRIQKQMQQKSLKPAIVWIVLNYQTSMEDVELELVKLAPEAPVIVIVNKCDFLQRRHKELEQDSTCLEQFDQLPLDQLPTWMKNNKGLLSKRERLLNWKQTHEHVRRILILSLGDSDQYDDDDDEAHRPIGPDILLEATWGCLDDVARIKLAQIQRESKIGHIKASVAIIAAAMASAGGAAWIPLPTVDSIVISSIQVTMVISLYKLWGVVGVDAKTFATVFMKSLLPVILSFAAGYSAANVLKFFFGIGTLIGGALDMVIATCGTLLIGIVVTAYLSQNVYNRHQTKTKEALQEDIQSFMGSGRFKQLVDDVKTLAKNPRKISKTQIANILEKKT